MFAPNPIGFLQIFGSTKFWERFLNTNGWPSDHTLYSQQKQAGPIWHGLGTVWGEASCQLIHCSLHLLYHVVSLKETDLNSFKILQGYPKAQQVILLTSRYSAVNSLPPSSCLGHDFLDPWGVNHLGKPWTLPVDSTEQSPSEMYPSLLIYRILYLVFSPEIHKAKITSKSNGQQRSPKGLFWKPNSSMS